MAYKDLEEKIIDSISDEFISKCRENDDIHSVFDAVSAITDAQGVAVLGDGLGTDNRFFDNETEKLARTYFDLLNDAAKNGIVLEGTEVLTELFRIRAGVEMPQEQKENGNSEITDEKGEKVLKSLSRTVLSIRDNIIGNVSQTVGEMKDLQAEEAVLANKLEKEINMRKMTTGTRTGLKNLFRIITRRIKLSSLWLPFIPLMKNRKLPSPMQKNAWTALKGILPNRHLPGSRSGSANSGMKILQRRRCMKTAKQSKPITAILWIRN